MGRRPNVIYVRNDDEVRRLEHELYCARRTIVDLMPDDIAKRLRGFYDCRSEHDFDQWQQLTITFIIEQATAIPEASYFQKRGMCPLCGRGSTGPYETGFALPGGLYRHLEGYGNVSPCPVTNAAFRIARTQLAQQFKETEAERTRQDAERRENELLFVTDPEGKPQLRDELCWNRKPRTETEFDTAEKELLALGFQRIADGNVVSYRLTQEGYLILADPRASGRIDFIVSPNCNKGARGRQISFYLLDSWRKDRRGKFTQRASDAISSLAGDGAS